MSKNNNTLSLEHPPDLSVFDFTDYREFLKNYYDLMKATRPHFSHRYFSRMAGLGGKNYLQMVIGGKRNLSPSTIARFIRGIRLPKKEAAYFESMVLYNQADSDSEKEHYFAQLVQLRPATKIQGISQDQFEYLTQSLYVVLRELSAMPEFSEEVDVLRQCLRSRAKPAEIKKALEVLERLKLLVRDESGKLKHSGRTLETPENVESLEILNYHRKILNETREALINISYDERDINSMTIPMPRYLIPSVKEVLRKAREEIAQLVNQSTHEYYEVFQINTQFFPVTRTKQVKKKGENG